MNDLMNIIKAHYPHATIVNDEANCNNSVKFTRHGTALDNIYFAIKTKNGNLEIYKNITGLLVEII